MEEKPMNSDREEPIRRDPVSDKEKRNRIGTGERENCENIPQHELKVEGWEPETSSEEERGFLRIRLFKRKDRKRQWSVMKGLATNVAVGIISSFLTVSVLSFTNIPLLNKQETNIKAETSDRITLQQSEDTVYTETFQKTGETTVADIVEELSPAIVGVVNIQQMSNRFNLQTEKIQSGSGSGVIFHKDKTYGYIITNNHVIEGANEVEISLYNGKKTDAQIVGADALTDLAVLRIDGKYVDKVARFGDSSQLRPGDEVIAIGNPLGLEFSRTVTRGIVSATERNIPVSTSAGDWELTVIQTDAAINPGNSGGALINSRGEVIGINSLKISQTGVEGLGFAIPSNDVIPIAEQLIENGSVKRPYLGVQLYNVSDIAEFYRQNLVGSLKDGIIITGVEENSPAKEAGLQENDVIVGVDGNDVQNTTDFKKYLYKHVKPGEKISVEIYRNGKKETIPLTTGGN